MATNINKPASGTVQQQPSQNTMVKPKGTGFTNLQSLLKANQGAGQKIASTIGSQIQGQAGQAKQALTQASDQFKTGIQGSQATVAGGQNLTGELGKINFVTQKPQEQQAADAPVNQSQAQAGLTALNQQASENLSRLNNDQNVKLIQDLNKGYQGPQGLAGAEALRSQALQAQQLGQMTASDMGRQELLRRYVGGAGYNQGQRNLDNILLGQAANQLAGARRDTAGLERQATNEITGAAAQALGLGREFQTNASNINKDLRQKSTDLNAYLQAEAEGRTADAKVIADRMKASLTDKEGGYLTEEDANLLNQALEFDKVTSKNKYNTSTLQGVNSKIQAPEIYDASIYNLTPDQIGNLISSNKFNKENVITDKDIQAQSALNRLFGSENLSNIQKGEQLNNINSRDLTNNLNNITAQVEDINKNIMDRSDLINNLNNYASKYDFSNRSNIVLNHEKLLNDINNARNSADVIKAIENASIGNRDYTSLLGATDFNPRHIGIPTLQGSAKEEIAQYKSYTPFRGLNSLIKNK